MPVLLTNGINELEESARKEFGRFFGRRLVDAMYEKSMDATGLGVATRISQSTISRYMRGVGSPTAYNLYKIAIVLDKPIDYFF